MKIKIFLDCHVKSMAEIERLQAVMILAASAKGHPVVKSLPISPMQRKMTAILTYPLHKPVRVDIVRETNFWFVGEVVWEICKAYEDIYKKSKANVWGHVLSDLVIEGLEIDTDTYQIDVTVGS